jgi:hypothetical protein
VQFHGTGRKPGYSETLDLLGKAKISFQHSGRTASLKAELQTFADFF